MSSMGGNGWGIIFGGLGQSLHRLYVRVIDFKAASRYYYDLEGLL